jgi:acyl carrier protein
MTRSMSVSPIDELVIRREDRAFSLRVGRGTQQHSRAASELLSHDRVVTEIIQAVRGMRTSFSEREVTGDTNLALDLGLESASRVELLLDVQRALDVALDVGVVVMFAELTITQLAELIVALPESSMDR